MSEDRGTGGGLPRSTLLPGAADQPEGARSLLLEVLTRVLHPTMLVVAVHLFVVGLDRPGGGFAAGLLVGLGLVLRRLAGGRHDVGAAARLPAGLVLGAGLLLAAGYASAGLLLGLGPLAEAHGEVHLPVVGAVAWGTSYLLDLAVVLVVVGLVVDVLRTLGGEGVNETNLTLSVVVAVLVAGGVYLLLQRELMRVVLGFVLLGHGANLVLLVSGGPAGAVPEAGMSAQEVSDPLPQAMALTAVVITFAVTALLLALTYRHDVLLGGDDTAEPPEVEHDGEQDHDSLPDSAA